MGLFDRDYDRNFTNRGGMWRGGEYDRNFRGGEYDRTNRGGFAGGYRRTGASSGGYDRGMRAGTSRYDQPYWGYDTWDYDREYKSRQQTDYGDPFGDRQENTPIRMVEDRDRDRGWFGWGNDYSREYRGYGREYRGYGNDYRRTGSGSGAGYQGRNPVGYDPYQSRRNDMDRLRGRTRGYDRNYDSGWF